MVHLYIYIGIIGKFKKKLFLSLNIDFALANSVDSDEMPYYAGISSGSSLRT